MLASTPARPLIYIYYLHSHLHLLVHRSHTCCGPCVRALHPTIPYPPHHRGARPPATVAQSETSTCGRPGALTRLPNRTRRPSASPNLLVKQHRHSACTARGPYACCDSKPAGSRLVHAACGMQMWHRVQSAALLPCCACCACCACCVVWRYTLCPRRYHTAQPACFKLLPRHTEIHLRVPG